MTQTIFKRTQKHEQESATDPGSGCLLQIKPVELNACLQSIDTPRFVIGRQESCDLSINDVSVSRRHCELRKTARGYLIIDLESTNGTFVGDREIDSQLLVAGDQIRIGNRIFKFITSDHFEAQYHEAVYSMMTRDSLTGVWNKRYFRDLLTRDLSRMKRSNAPIALILLDIDHFKQVNDTYGHLAGDEVLAEIGQRLTTALRHDEALARIGGEEFAILLNDVDLDRASATAERCAAAVRNQPFSTSVGSLPITISMGVAIADPADDVSADELIQRADECLYDAKERGRNRVSCRRRPS